MKKVFVLLCAVLPGGLVLLVTMMMFTACARLQFQDPAGNVKISGLTASPEMAMVMSAEAEAIRAQAYATRKCADEPAGCYYGWGYGNMDTPAGYTWAGIRAAGAAGSPPASESGDVRKDVADIKRTVRGISEWKRVLSQTLKNRKKGN